MNIRSLLKLPKEHGAWAMLYVPMALGALVSWKVSWNLLLFAFSATFVFIARESLLVWWRARSRGKPDSRSLTRTVVYLGLAGITGVPLVLISHRWALVPLGSAALALLAINAAQATRREDRTVGGEMLAIAGLTMTAPAAHYSLTGTLHAEAVWLWAASALYFASSVFYVKLRVSAVNPRRLQESRRARLSCALYHGSLLLTLFALALADALSLFAIAAFTPVIARAFWSLAQPGGGLNLKRLGVLEIVYSVVFLVFITLTFRQA